MEDDLKASLLAPPEIAVSLKKRWERWLYLLFVSMLTCGVCYCYDNPQALESAIESDLGIGATSYTVLYGVYSFPNMFVPLIGGALIDWLGVNIAIFLFTMIVCAGQSLFMLGGYQQSYLLMVLGRILFGIGSESVVVCQSACISKWFKSKELAFAFMMGLLVSRVSSSLNAFITPLLYTTYGNLGTPLLVGNMVALLSVFAGLICIAFEMKEIRIEKQNLEAENLARSIVGDSSEVVTDVPIDDIAKEIEEKLRGDDE